MANRLFAFLSKKKSTIRCSFPQIYQTPFRHLLADICRQLTIRNVDHDRIALIYIVLQDELGRKRLDMLLDISLDRSCAVGGIIGRVSDKLFSRVREPDRDLSVLEPSVEVRDDQIDDSRL